LADEGTSISDVISRVNAVLELQQRQQLVLDRLAQRIAELDLRIGRLEAVIVIRDRG